MTTTDPDPQLFLATYRGTDYVVIKHRGREVEVSFSRLGNNVRAWVDGKEMNR